MSYSVLIVDDDVKLAKLLKAYFDREGFATYLSFNGLDALHLAEEIQPDLLILDIMLPGIDGWEVCRRIREQGVGPAIIMLTARDEENDRLTSLELGADEYVAKPFSPRDVVTRAKAILGCMSVAEYDLVEPVQAAGLVIDVAEHAVRKDGRVIGLTPTEARLLAFMAADADRTFTRMQIAERIQGNVQSNYERTTDVHIKNIRQKIEDNPKDPRYIKTVYGIGYRFCG